MPQACRTQASICRAATGLPPCVPDSSRSCNRTTTTTRPRPAAAAGLSSPYAASKIAALFAVSGPLEAILMPSVKRVSRWPSDTLQLGGAPGASLMEMPKWLRAMLKAALRGSLRSSLLLRVMSPAGVTWEGRGEEVRVRGVEA